LTSSVRPTDFLRWVRQTAPDWTIPPELVDMAAHSKSAARVTSDDQHANGVGTSARWPWGSYETKLLGVMAEAVHELWSTYDPDQPETAPTQPDVVKFIKQRLTEVGYANPDAIATAMATIIRHEKAPTGRRRKARH
jgi:hypothetical protein